MKKRRKGMEVDENGNLRPGYIYQINKSRLVQIATETERTNLFAHKEAMSLLLKRAEYDIRELVYQESGSFDIDKKEKLALALEFEDFVFRYEENKKKLRIEKRNKFLNALKGLPSAIELKEIHDFVIPMGYKDEWTSLRIDLPSTVIDNDRDMRSQMANKFQSFIVEYFNK